MTGPAYPEKSVPLKPRACKGCGKIVTPHLVPTTAVPEGVEIVFCPNCDVGRR